MSVQELSANEPSIGKAATDEVEAATPSPVSVLQKFIQGITPTRRCVRLFANGATWADLDLVDNEIRLAKLAATPGSLKDLQRQRRALVKRMLESNYLDVMVEAWTPDHSDEFAAEMETAGIESVKERNLRQTAAQIVEPAGLTYEDLVDLDKAIPNQVARLVKAVAEANTADWSVDVPL